MLFNTPVSLAADGVTIEKSYGLIQLENDSLISKVDTVLKESRDTLGLRSYVRPILLGNKKQSELAIYYTNVKLANLCTKTKVNSNSLYLSHAHSMCRYLNQVRSL